MELDGEDLVLEMIKYIHTHHSRFIPEGVAKAS
jgi:hypothetical protein